MLEYFTEIIGILISIVILKHFENYLKNSNVLETSILRWVFEFIYWWVCFFVMFLTLAFIWAIFGFETLNNLESAILLSSVNGFSSRVFGYIEFWILALLTIYFGITYGGVAGVILSISVFVFTNYCGELVDMTAYTKKLKLIFLKLKTNIVKLK